MVLRAAQSKGLQDIEGLDSNGVLARAKRYVGFPPAGENRRSWMSLEETYWCTILLRSEDVYNKELSCICCMATFNKNQKPGM